MNPDHFFDLSPRTKEHARLMNSLDTRYWTRGHTVCMLHRHVVTWLSENLCNHSIKFVHANNYYVWRIIFVNAEDKLLFRLKYGFV